MKYDEEGDMSKSTEFVKNAIDELQYYVYIYSDPETKIPFYIGKGKGNRCFNHLFQTGESEKCLRGIQGDFAALCLRSP